MRIDRVRLEVGRKCSQEQLVEDVAMIYSDIRGDLAKSPIGQGFGCKIDLS